MCLEGGGGEGAAGGVVVNFHILPTWKSTKCLVDIYSQYGKGDKQDPNRNEISSI